MCWPYTQTFASHILMTATNPHNQRVDQASGLAVLFTSCAQPGERSTQVWLFGSLVLRPGVAAREIDPVKILVKGLLTILVVSRFCCA